MVSKYVYIYIYILRERERDLRSTPHEQKVTQGHFLSRVSLVYIRGSISPR